MKSNSTGLSMSSTTRFFSSSGSNEEEKINFMQLGALAALKNTFIEIANMRLPEVTSDDAGKLSMSSYPFYGMKYEKIIMGKCASLESMRDAIRELYLTIVEITYTNNIEAQLRRYADQSKQHGGISDDFTEKWMHSLSLFNKLVYELEKQYQYYYLLLLAEKDKTFLCRSLVSEFLETTAENSALSLKMLALRKFLEQPMEVLGTVLGQPDFKAQLENLHLRVYEQIEPVLSATPTKAL